MIKGFNAFEVAVEENVQEEKKSGLRKMEVGESFVAGVCVGEFVKADLHSMFDVANNRSILFNVKAEKGSLLDKARELLWKDWNVAKKQGETALMKKIQTHVNAIKPYENFYFGFTDLETGEPTFIRVSTTHAKTLANSIQEMAEQLATLPVKITRGDKGAWTIMPVFAKLTPEQQANFAKNAPIDEAKYDELAFDLSEERQIEALKFIGFDVTRVGVSASATENNEESQPEVDKNLSVEEQAKQLGF